MPGLTRRAFLIATALLAPGARALAREGHATTAPPISLDAFMRLSRRLVGRSALDAEVGRVYLESLLAVPENPPLLARLADGAATTAAETALERTIVECWYTGIYTLGGERRVATHFGALMWMASGAPAPGLCATAFGAWSQTPQGLV